MRFHHAYEDPDVRTNELFPKGNPTSHGAEWDYYTSFPNSTSEDMPIDIENTVETTVSATGNIGGELGLGEKIAFQQTFSLELSFSRKTTEKVSVKCTVPPNRMIVVHIAPAKQERTGFFSAWGSHGYTGEKPFALTTASGRYVQYYDEVPCP